MSVHPQIKCGDSCTHSSPLGKTVVPLYDLTLNDGQGTVHTPLEDTDRSVSVSDAVRADITVDRTRELPWLERQPVLQQRKD
jgi:hypothetical protein